MKKIVIPVCAVMCTISLAACGTGSKSKQPYDISVVYDGETKTYSFTDVSDIKIDTRQKDGYVLNGYYTQANGQGEELIDYKGKKVSDNWSNGAVTTLYPFYQKIDYTVTYKSVVGCEEKPESFGYNVYGSTTDCEWKISKFMTGNLEYIYKVAYGNPDIKLIIRAYSEMRATGDGKITYKLGIGAEMDGAVIASDSFKLPKDYVQKTLACHISGKTLLNNSDRKVIIGAYYNSIWTAGYFKNLYWTLEFVQPETSPNDTPVDDKTDNT